MAGTAHNRGPTHTAPGRGELAVLVSAGGTHHVARGRAGRGITDLGYSCWLVSWLSWFLDDGNRTGLLLRQGVRGSVRTATGMRPGAGSAMTRRCCAPWGVVMRRRLPLCMTGMRAG